MFKKLLILITLIFMLSFSFAAVGDNLISYYKLDEASGTSFTDEVSTFTGTGTNANISGGTGILNYGGSFNGSTYINTGYNTINNATGFSMQAWIKTSSDGHIISRDDTSSQRFWQFKVIGGKIQVLAFKSTSGLIAVNSTGSVNDGAWHHIVYTFDTTNGHNLYIDGSSDGSDADTTSLKSGNGEEVYIGQVDNFADHEYFNGIIDEVGIWTKKLSQTEVSSLYASGSAWAYPFVPDNVTADYNYDIDETNAQIILEDNSEYDGAIEGNEWTYLLDDTNIYYSKTSGDFNYSTTELLDLNIGLRVDTNTGQTDLQYYDFNTGAWYVFTNDIEATINSSVEKIYLDVNALMTYGTITNYSWIVDGSTVAATQTYNFTAQQNTDYNICSTLTATGSDTNIYYDTNCLIVSVGSWSPQIDWIETSGSWLKDTVNLDFNITMVGLQTPGIKLYYSNTPLDFNNLIIDDTNVWDATGIICADYNFNDNTNCYYSFNTNTIADQEYDFDLNVYNTWGDQNDTVDLKVDNTAPVLTFDLNYINGFVSSIDVDFNLQCSDNLSPTNRYLLYLNDVNVNDTWETNNTALNVTNAILNGDNDTNAYCYDEAGNYSNDISAIEIYALWFNLINEDTGAAITNLQTDVNIATANVFTYDGNINYDLLGAFPTYFVGNDQVLRFDFTYDDLAETKISREMDFGLLDDQNANVCVAPFQTLYEQIFVSSGERSVVVYNDFANCYNLASSTKFAYENALMVKGYTIQKPYYLYTYDNDVKILLALLDGSTASVMNLDTLVFNRAEYTIDIATDTVGISPKLNTVTGAYDTNTVTIYYQSLRGTNVSAELNIYNEDTLLWSYTENGEPNEFLVEFYYGALDVNADNILTLQMTTTSIGGDVVTSEYYFYTDGSSYAGTINPILAIAIAFILMFVAITFVAYRYALGWFGMLMGIIAIGVLAMAPGYWYVRFAQAIILIIIIFIVLIFKNETAGLN